MQKFELRELVISEELSKAKEALKKEQFENQRLREVSVQALHQIKTMEASAQNIAKAIDFQDKGLEARRSNLQEDKLAMQKLRSELLQSRKDHLEASEELKLAKEKILHLKEELEQVKG